MPIIILPMHHEDIKEVAKLHSQAFLRQKNSIDWVRCNFAAFPRIMLFVARDEKDQIVGYIQWIQKSGFRNESVIELEQIAVLQNKRGKGIGALLIRESVNAIKNYLNDSSSKLKAILVSTRTDNSAQALYKKVLGAEQVAVIKDLYSHDEVIMIANVLS
ncbi:GNAT family N-acetyltransferase [Legionella sp.]|uniref:GNAT family N-acetyltransferase n=2 Tax=Legionella TaxID=445 RepID=UPI00257F988C|nr:GNAT family N-acetyltransferase [Legionella sp.]